MAMFQNLSSLLNQNKGPNTAQVASNQANQANQQQQQNIQQQQGAIGQAQVYNQGALNQNIQGMNQGAIQNQLNTKYQGPQAGTINVQPKNANNIAQQGAALGSTGGQMAMLNQQYGQNGRANYGAGQQRFDAALQARNSGFQQQRAEAQNAARRLMDQSGLGNSALNTQAQTTSQGTQKFVDRTKQGLGDFETGVKTKAEQDAAESNKSDLQTYQQYQDLRNKLAQGKASKDVLEKLGLSAGTRTYGANLADALNYQGGKGDATADQMVSKDDYNRFKMVQGLLGDKSNVLDESKAGSYQKGAFNPDQAKAKNILDTAHMSYNNALAPAQQGLERAQTLVNELQHAASLPSLGQQISETTRIQQKYGLNPNGGLARNLEWATKDNLVKNQNAFNQLQQQLDSAYAGTIGEDDG